MSKSSRILQRKNQQAANFLNMNTSSPVRKYDKTNSDRDLRNFISPVQLTRLKQDIASYRDSISEAERAYYPFRVKQQRMYIDTVLNGHVFSLMERRKDLTLLRKFKVCDAKKVQSDDLTQMIQEQIWFDDFVSYCLDAIFFGYTLISLGDIVDDTMQESSIVPRWFISPDRHVVGSYIYSPGGKDFREQPQSDWHIYVKTKSDNGTSPCGYGLFYQIAPYEIYLRNTLGYNADFVELYAMPYRVGKTTKTTESERAELEAAVRNMGSAGYAIIDPMDDIDFLETALGGTGYKGYESMEIRCQKVVSKLILGHADAVDSTPGKLGGGQGDKDESPTGAALADKQTRDARFIQPVINNQLFPRLKNLQTETKFKGIIIPDGYHFEYVNDGEEEEFREKEDASNLVTAQIAQTMKSAGLQMDAKYFQDRTGITSISAPLPEPILPGKQDPKLSDKAKNRLKELYR